jgi:hypothetical protein
VRYLVRGVVVVGLHNIQVIFLLTAGDRLTSDQIANGHWSAHKEYKKLAILLVRDKLTTKIDYKREKTGFTTTCITKENI